MRFPQSRSGALLFPSLEYFHPLPNLLLNSGTIRKWVWDWQFSILKVPSQILCFCHLALSTSFSPSISYLASFYLPYSLQNLPLVLPSSWLVRRLFGQYGKMCASFCCPEKDCVPRVLQNICDCGANMADAWTICQSSEIQFCTFNLLVHDENNGNKWQN